ncbi:DNA polymerase III subunit delta' [Dongshaea marina]|uniref:DNA polymerase III subunit delta' n=1 Tax=Dongshaea marina TaxID=2047966 RepID=UPI000D3EA62E|nr:DNA polymerase III subunit delta' [Dongshaea marina]
MLSYPWLEEPWQQLLTQKNNQRFPHALLLQAPDGMAHQELLKQLAKLLLCEAPTPQGYCGQCHSCRLFEAGNHPDLLQLEPETKTIGVDVIRVLGERFAKRPTLGRAQVALIESAGRLTENAANALLKTLEEPVSDSYLFLHCQSRDQLLPTITSRCYQQILTAPAEAITQKWLAQRLQHPPSMTELRLNQGLPLRVLRFCEKQGGEERKLIEAIGKLADSPQQVMVIRDLIAEEFEERLNWLLYFIQDLQRYLLGCSSESWVWQQAKASVESLGKRSSLAKVQRHYHGLLELKRQARPGTLVNPKLQLMSWLSLFYEDCCSRR